MNEGEIFNSVFLEESGFREEGVLLEEEVDFSRASQQAIGRTGNRILVI